ncbi:hypothetical protein C8A00DRAFT_16213 [Chaetomidium leptoderma]|uniref:Zn(2)-C6 fungal-type domain-containing protein n=1 Tax=Chaetomidium leptoderma TaxID=669021 RepID=A0AAN6VJ16_9PEZI|nr:hypothetical protein C8A00DRAFT_16213 [Chaetomidium leptoderma]
MNDTGSQPHESPPADGEELERPRKKLKVRKGTRSCWECKRRKVRCTFARPADSLCNGCRRRATPCISQEFPDAPALVGSSSKPAGVEDRLGRVEELVEQLLEQLVNNPSTPYSPHKDPGPSDLQLLDSRLPRPLFTLATVDVTRALQGPRVDSKYDDLSRRLSKAWPSQHNLDLLLNVPVYNSELLLQKGGCTPDDSCSASLRETLQLPPPGSHPILMARKLLLLGIFLQGAWSGSPSNEPAGLHPSCQIIMSRVVEAAGLVTGNDELCTSIEGIQCIMMESMYHDTAGNLRRACVAIRRAITMAQMMGLHRGAAANTSFKAQTKVDPEFMWFRLVQTDRYIALMLDMPQGSSDNVFAAPRVLESCAPVERMRRIELLAVGRILQRSAADVDNYAATLEIDELLQKASACMPPQWWLIPNVTTTSMSRGPVAAENDDNDKETTTPAPPDDMMILMDQFAHYHLVARLHLPYLLHFPPTDDDDDDDDNTPPHDDRHHHTRPYMYSQITAVHATREMLARFVAFRTLGPTASYCRGMDFFAFIASATLCLAHVEGWRWRRHSRRCHMNRRKAVASTTTSSSHISDGGGGGYDYHCNHHHLDLLAHQRPSDRGLMERALSCIEHVANSVNGGDAMGAKMVLVLGRLLAIEEDAANGGGGDDGYYYRITTSSCPSSSSSQLGGGCPADEVGAVEIGTVSEGGDGLCISIPHFGTVEVKKRVLQSVVVPETVDGGGITGMDEWALHGVDMAFENLIGGLGEPDVPAEEQWTGWLGLEPS